MSEVEAGAAVAHAALYRSSGSWSITLADTPLLTVPTVSPSACRSCGGRSGEVAVVVVVRARSWPRAWRRVQTGCGAC
jgi:hypothetical protein